MPMYDFVDMPLSAPIITGTENQGKADPDQEYPEDLEAVHLGSLLSSSIKASA